MSEKKQEEFQPYIPADRVMPELTVASVVIGVILAIVFGAANAYLGLRVGLTIAASIPSAVISMGVIRVLLHRNSILENNVVQTIGSAGVSIASGIIFTVPVMFMWSDEWGTEPPSIFMIFFIALVGGVLGIIFMIPLRRALIVKEHGTLTYPEGTACAEVLLAGEEGGNKASTVFAGLGIAAGYKFVADGLKIFPSTVHLETSKLGYAGGGLGLQALPALLGVGYICGFRVSTIMFGGSLFAWMIIMPLIAFFGGDATMYPGTTPISGMDSNTLWDNYIRYIGAGALATGGIISLVKSLPLIVSTFKTSFRSFSFKTPESALRTEQDIPLMPILILTFMIFLALWLVPVVPVNLTGAVMIIVIGFLFATVSSRLVGLVGSSNNPVSGMAIAALLISTIVFKATGLVGQAGMMGALTIGAVICITASIAGDTSQDLKTGFIVGATPRKQQLGELFGVIGASLAIGAILYLLNSAWAFGSSELPAPQAILMKMIIEGIMGGSLPWTLVFIGAVIAIAVELLGIPVLPFAIGLYLPIDLNAAVFCGGVVKWIVDHVGKCSDETRKDRENRGLLYCSGLIAGEGLVGVVLAVLAIIPLGAGTLADFIDLSGMFSIGGVGTIVIFGLLIASLFYVLYRRARKGTDVDETQEG